MFACILGIMATQPSTPEGAEAVETDAPSHGTQAMADIAWSTLKGMVLTSTVLVVFGMYCWDGLVWFTKTYLDDSILGFRPSYVSGGTVGVVVALIFWGAWFCIQGWRDSRSRRAG